MLDAFEAGGDFHSRTAMNMYDHIREDVEKGKVLLEWHSQLGEDKPPAPLLKVCVKFVGNSWQCTLFYFFVTLGFVFRSRSL